MTRFDAATEDERRDLFVDAMRAHRERESAFLTIEAEPSDAVPDDADDPVPWVQFADDIMNLDCTDAELDRLKSLLDSYPAFTIKDLTSPEEAAGTNIRVSIRADNERVAAFTEQVFLDVYESPTAYRAWVTAV